jgi:hypothetical protein
VKNAILSINTWDAPLQKISELAHDAKYAEAMLALKQLGVRTTSKNNSAPNNLCGNPKEWR